MINKVIDITNNYFDEFKELSNEIYNNPELGLEEKYAAKLHRELLERHNFKITRNVCNMETAFYGVYDSGKSGVSMGYIAEYDALKDIGHGCGHNVLGAVGTGAAIVLSKLIDEIGGKVVLFGTPAEETIGGKVIMQEQKIFNNADTIIEAHPAQFSANVNNTLALISLKVNFYGKGAHAAFSPEEGINALDAIILLFDSVNAQRHKLDSDVKINGIIVDGGKEPNTIPDKTTGLFHLRGKEYNKVKELNEMFNRCVEGAAVMTGCTYDVVKYEETFLDLISNKILASVFGNAMKDVGVEFNIESIDISASADIGNVSYCVPTIHPLFAITKDVSIVAHTKKFANETTTEFCYQQMRKTIAALAKTGYDVITNPEVYKEIRNEFEEKLKSLQSDD